MRMSVAPPQIGKGPKVGRVIAPPPECRRRGLGDQGAQVETAPKLDPATVAECGGRADHANPRPMGAAR